MYVVYIGSSLPSSVVSPFCPSKSVTVTGQSRTGQAAGLACQPVTSRPISAEAKNANFWGPATSNGGWTMLKTLSFDKWAGHRCCLSPSARMLFRMEEIQGCHTWIAQRVGPRAWPWEKRACKLSRLVGIAAISYPWDSDEDTHLHSRNLSEPSYTWRQHVWRQRQHRSLHRGAEKTPPGRPRSGLGRS